MTVKTQQFSIDGWYRWPFALTDRLGGGELWAFFLSTGIVALAAPWWTDQIIAASGQAYRTIASLKTAGDCRSYAQNTPTNGFSTSAPTFRWHDLPS